MHTQTLTNTDAHTQANKSKQKQWEEMNKRQAALECECVSVWMCECVSVWVCECVCVWVCECVKSGGKVPFSKTRREAGMLASAYSTVCVCVCVCVMLWI